MAKKAPQKKNAGMTVALMILATLFSKLLGMVRQVLVADIFADSPAGVAFAAASGIPLAIFDMLFAAAVLGAFLPIYRGTVFSDGARAEKFAASFFTLVGIVTAAVALAGVLLAAPILSLVAPRLEAETAALAVRLLRIMFPAMIFAGMAYTLVGILQSHESFLLPALVSALSNVIMIVYLLLCGGAPNEATVYGLAIAYLCSWGVQFLTLALPLFRKHRMPSLTLALRNPDLHLACRRSLPVMFGSWLLPAGTLLATAFSSLVGDSALAAYTYSFSIYSILTGVLTYGVCNFLFPRLSGNAAEGNNDRYAEELRRGIFASLAMVLPVAVATFLLAREGVCILYLRGNFSKELAMNVAASLRMLAPAMPAFCLFELLSRAAYADGRVKLPMIAALSGVGANALCAALFLFAEHLTIETVALSNLAGQWTATLLLIFLPCRARPGILRGISSKKSLSLLLCTTLCAATMVMIARILQKNADFSSFTRNFLTLGLVFLPAIMVYLICMILSGVIRFSRPRR